MVYQELQRLEGARSHSVTKQESQELTIYSFVVILQPLASGKESLCLTAYFKEPPFRFEIDEWALQQVGRDVAMLRLYQVADSFLKRRNQLIGGCPMYLKQIVEGGGNFYEEYGYDEPILEEEPTDIYLMGLGDGEVAAIPMLPESGEYWDGYCSGLRDYWLKQQGKEVIKEM